MKYKQIYNDILNMKCVKLYKPLLLLSYVDYLEIMNNVITENEYLVDIETLLPFFNNYLRQDIIIKSGYGIPNINDISSKKLLDTLVTGPLFRIESEVHLFTAIEKDNQLKFGLASTNESINLSLLFNNIRDACVALIKSLITTDIKLLNTSLYKEMVHQISCTKIDLNHHPKIYKYLVILAYIDYFKDLDIINLCFKMRVPVDEIFIYYKLYFNIPQFADNILTSSIKESSDQHIKKHMCELPIRKLCKDDTFFKCTQLDKTSRKIENLPTDFGIIINEKSLCNDIMIQVISNCIQHVIRIRTNKTININLTTDIKYSTIDIKKKDHSPKTVYSPARYGQSQYRKSLLEKYECTCAICNFDFVPVLVASHAMPWKDCTSTHQRLSTNNGLLLCEYHDALFDKGYITFDSTNNFNVIFSNDMTQASIDHFYSFYDNKIPKFVATSPKLSDYLDYHKNNVFNV